MHRPLAGPLSRLPPLIKQGITLRPEILAHDRLDVAENPLRFRLEDPVLLIAVLFV